VKTIKEIFFPCLGSSFLVREIFLSSGILDRKKARTAALENAVFSCLGAAAA
jgi:hypothetical protein